jgi:hypothetical protein
MIEIKDGNVTVEGSLEEIIFDLSNTIQAVITILAENINKNHDVDIRYEDLIKLILIQLAGNRKTGISKNTIPEDIKQNFYIGLHALREENKNSDTFINFELNNKGLSLKFKETDFFIDPRLTDESFK